MYTEDFALVVGINRYPDLGDLSGPELDARAFLEWLVDPAGGGIPQANATLIISAKFGDPDAMTTASAQPTIQDVSERLLGWAREGKERRRLGRRLYLFFAGHGLALHRGQLPFADECGILAANAERELLGLHVAAKAWADFFRVRRHFDEVVLIMDCCRESRPLTPPAGLPVNLQLAEGQQPLARYLYAFATPFGQAAREGPWGPNGTTRGRFTLALLNALRGAAVVDGTKIVYPERLQTAVREYLHNVPAVQSAAMREERPEFLYDKDAPVVFALSNPECYVIRYSPPPNVKAGTVMLYDGRFEVVARDQSMSGWGWRLPHAGLYRLHVDEQKYALEISGPLRELDAMSAVCQAAA